MSRIYLALTTDFMFISMMLLPFLDTNLSLSDVRAMMAMAALLWTCDAYVRVQS